MKHKFILVIVIIAGVLSGCNLTSPAVTPTMALTAAPTLEFVQSTSVQPATPYPVPSEAYVPPTPLLPQQAVLDRAFQVVVAIKDKDMTALSGYVHPKMGLRFSPYAFVKETDQVFPADKLAGLLTDNTIYTWGAYDGTGEPIELTFSDYYSKFVYDEGFAHAPQMALNHSLGESTTMNNAAEFYSNEMIVEFYIPSIDPKYEGMDWRSLRLVFLKEDSTWYLVGIIHDQWTT